MRYIDEKFVGEPVRRPGREIRRWREECGQRLVAEAAALTLGGDFAELLDALDSAIVEAEEELERKAEEVGLPAERYAEVAAKCERLKAAHAEARHAGDRARIHAEWEAAVAEREDAGRVKAAVTVRKSKALERLKALRLTQRAYREALEGIHTPLLQALREVLS